jgi:hypothetical protein
MSPAAAAPAPSNGIPGRIGMAIMLMALFCLFSGALDFGLYQLHIAVALYAASLLTTALVGGIQRALSHRIAWLLAAFYGWLAIGIPLSTWPGGSFGLVEVAIEFGFGVYVIVAGQAHRHADLRRTVHVLGYGGLVLAVLTSIFGVVVDGRLAPKAGHYGNPNDFGQVLLITLPFWWYMIRTPLSSRLRRVIAVFASVFLLLVTIRTGSRGALIGLLCVALILFLDSTSRQKIAIITVGAALGCCAILLLPHNVQRRYVTLFQEEAPNSDEPISEEEAKTVGSAAGSSESRLEMLKDSLYLTAIHPLFGVGAGQFTTAQNSLAQERGALQGRWLVTHNSYTQVSSEGGIPALIFYAGALGCCIWVARSRFPAGTLRDPVLEDIAQLSIALRAALIAYAVSTIFISVAYNLFLPVLAALSVVFDRTVAQTIGSRAAGRAPVPVPPRPRSLGLPVVR